MSTESSTGKLKYIVIPIAAVASLFILSNLLSYGIYILLVRVLKIQAAQLSSCAFLAETLVSAVLLLVFFAAGKMIFKHDDADVKPLSAKTALLCTLSGFGVSGVSYLWILLVDRLPMLSSSLSAMDKANSDMSGGLAGVFITAVIAAPLLEEILFRKIVFGSFQKVLPFWAAVVISGIIFGAYHMNVVQAVYTSVMGMIAAAVYAKTKNLCAPILLHMANNFLGFMQTAFTAESFIKASDVFSVIMIVPLVSTLMFLKKIDDR